MGAECGVFGDVARNNEVTLLIGSIFVLGGELKEKQQLGLDRKAGGREGGVGN